MINLHIASLSCVLGLLPPTLAAAAGTFEPKPVDVCTKSTANPKLLVLDPRKVVAQLVEKNAGISSIDLDTTGAGVVFPETAQALLNPAGFCSNHRCSKKVESSLGLAFVQLLSFVDRHASRTQTAPFIDTSGLQIGTEPLRQFLLGRAKLENVCVLAPPPVIPPVAGPTEPGFKIGGVDWADIPHYFSLRQNVEDLPIPQADDRFKGLKQASVSWADDRVAQKSSFAVNLAAGYTVGRLSLDEDGHYLGQATSFLTYDQQFIQAATAAKSSQAQNIGFGIMGDVTFPALISGYQNVQFYPKYVRSLSNNAEVVSGNFVYTPMYGIPGIDNVYYLILDTLSFQFTPKLKTVVHDVLNVGTDASLATPGTFYWYGPQLSLAVYGEGLLEGFTYTASYEYYEVVRGPLLHVSLFQTALNYDIGKTKLVSLQLKYQKGRNLDTLEPLDQVTLGLGVKY
jgi:hypothetical protein